MSRKIPEERRKFGQFLKASREAVGKTQNDVKKALGLNSDNTVSQFERGYAALPTLYYGKYADGDLLATAPLLSPLISTLCNNPNIAVLKGGWDEVV